MIYLDNAATTPMYEKCVEVYKKYACTSFFNPSAGYKEAIDVSKDLIDVRKRILAKLGAKGGTVVFTGGATESNNLAIMGSKRNGKWEYVFTEGDHPSVYNVAKELESQGFVVHFVGLQENGAVDYNKLEEVINEKTRLISVIHVSNETGVVNDIERINAIRNRKSPKALLHVDGVQAFCKIQVNVSELGVDFYTVSAHKFHGPKGVGALYVKNPNGLKSIIFGGGQESGYRSGTENVAGVMAMDCAISSINVDENFKKVFALKKKAIELFSNIQGVSCVMSESPYILSVSFNGVNGETLMRALCQEGVIVGKGSACSTKKAGNRVLESMGVDKESVKSYVRLSFSELLTEEDVVMACQIIKNVYKDIYERVK